MDDRKSNAEDKKADAKQTTYRDHTNEISLVNMRAFRARPMDMLIRQIRTQPDHPENLVIMDAINQDRASMRRALECKEYKAVAALQEVARTPAENIIVAMIAYTLRSDLPVHARLLRSAADAGLALAQYECMMADAKDSQYLSSLQEQKSNPIAQAAFAQTHFLRDQTRRLAHRDNIDQKEQDLIIHHLEQAIALGEASSINYLLLAKNASLNEAEKQHLLNLAAQGGNIRCLHHQINHWIDGPHSEENGLSLILNSRFFFPQVPAEILDLLMEDFHQIDTLSDEICYHLGCLLDQFEQCVELVNNPLNRDFMNNLRNRFNHIATQNTELFLDLLNLESRRDQKRIYGLLNKQAQVHIKAQAEDPAALAALASAGLLPDVARIAVNYNRTFNFTDDINDNDNYQELQRLADNLNKKTHAKDPRAQTFFQGRSKTPAPAKTKPLAAAPEKRKRSSSI